MFNLINKMFGNPSAGSKDIAKERLRMVLVNDRVNVSPQFMNGLRDDMIKVISPYMEIDESQMQVSLTTSKSSVSLVANIPVHRMKRIGNTNETGDRM